MKVNPAIFTPPPIPVEVATPVTNIRVCSPFPGSRTSYPPQGSRISKGAVINSDIALNDDPPSDSDESVVGEEVHEPVVQVAGIEALPLPVQLGLAGGDQQDVVVEVTVPVVQLPGPGAGGDTLTTVQVVLQHSLLTYGNLLTSSVMFWKSVVMFFQCPICARRRSPVSPVVKSLLVNQRRTTFLKRTTICTLSVMTTTGKWKTYLCNIYNQ